MKELRESRELAITKSFIFKKGRKMNWRENTCRYVDQASSELRVLTIF